MGEGRKKGEGEREGGVEWGGVRGSGENHRERERGMGLDTQTDRNKDRERGVES